MQSPSDLELDEYQRIAAAYDKSVKDPEGPNLLLLGLFGEVGSLLSELKKKQRDKNAYFAYSESTIEEVGDVLWYLANLASRRGVKLSTVAQRALSTPAEYHFVNPGAILTFRELQPQGRLYLGPQAGAKVERRLLMLGAKASDLLASMLSAFQDADALHRALADVFRLLIDSADDAEISLEEAAARNLRKIDGRWPEKRNWGALYDDAFDDDEKFPREIRIAFKEKDIRGKKFVIQKCNDINVGDRLTDNRANEDDYRFHDVFHISFAAILGWSPVLRALLKLKRKSDDTIDETQDGARAIIAEEGISNWIFSQGLRHNLFEGVNSLDFAMLKTIKDMVRGYEVETRPLWMWEHAILRGFHIFRALKDARGGVVVADLKSRTIEFLGPVP
jgi:NTP pyrophosphatase (non-canonical NTP hydrolase)